MLEILLWFMHGCLLGFVILIYTAIIGLVMYGVFSIAFALFDALGIENPILVIWEWVKCMGKRRKCGYEAIYRFYQVIKKFL